MGKRGGGGRVWKRGLARGGGRHHVRGLDEDGEHHSRGVGRGHGRRSGAAPRQKGLAVRVLRQGPPVDHLQQGRDGSGVGHHALHPRQP